MHLNDVVHFSATTGAARPAGDAELVPLIAAGDHGAFEVLMRRHNTRLFRAARAILKDDALAEEAVQDAYLDAYRHIKDFRGDSQVGTWLTRIAVNQALMRLRKEKRVRNVISFEPPPDVTASPTESPMASTLRHEIRQLLERTIDDLPSSFRTVFVLREVEEMSVEETAQVLGIPPATVRSRLFRARALLRQALARDVDRATGDVFAFAGARCDRIVATVLERIREQA